MARLDPRCESRGYTQVTAYVENFLVAAWMPSSRAQTAALAAESLGLGIPCYIGNIRNNTEAVSRAAEAAAAGLPNHRHDPGLARGRAA